MHHNVCRLCAVLAHNQTGSLLLWPGQVQKPTRKNQIGTTKLLASPCELQQGTATPLRIAFSRMQAVR